MYTISIPTSNSNKSINCSPKTSPLSIQKSPTIKINTSFRDNTNTYILTQNNFDPTKFSPPNEFMLKLKNRMNIYDDDK
jgi:hypothetical protein